MISQLLVDHVKLILALLASLVLLISFLAPLLKIVPYWNNQGRPSGIMLGRLGMRLFMLLLLLHEAVFPLNRLFGNPIDQIYLSIGAMPILFVLSLLFIHSWVYHPDGVKGL